MKLALLATLAGSAAAFAPAQTGALSTALNADFSKELGVQMPLGYFGGGFLKDADQERFDRLREVELKHGRISMLAVTGYLTTAAGIRFPGAEDIPDGFAAWGALAKTQDGCNVLLQMAFFFGLAEIINRPAEWADVTPEFPGDYRNGAIDFGWDKQTDEWKMRKRAIELNNGRAAQMGILGLMIHEINGVSVLPGNYLPGH
mmetsp:Transcript_13808/g.22615  ORF Transcript_13808/g.22615 Transcript_13808/m.22615 type:complete len:202 (+) Transcript_13808:2-607(+)